MADNFNEVLNNLGGAFGLPENFLLELVKEDDWSFIIKSHALLEAAISQLLTHRIGDQRLLPVFELLELGNVKTGKLAFVKSMGLLPHKSLLFIRWLSEVRNKLVHKIENVNFDISKYISGFDKNQIKKFSECIYQFLEVTDSSTEIEELTRRGKANIWYSTIVLVAEAHDAISEAKLEKDFIDEQLRLLKEFKSAGACLANHGRLCADCFFFHTRTG